MARKQQCQKLVGVVRRTGANSLCFGSSVTVDESSNYGFRVPCRNQCEWQSSFVDCRHAFSERRLMIYTTVPT